MEEDWEMLQKSDLGLVPAPDSADNSRDFQIIEGGSEGVIRSDYFALDSERRCPKKFAEDDREESCLESNNLSWVDPPTQSPYGDEAKGELGLSGIQLPLRNSGPFLSDSIVDESVARKSGDLEEKSELGRGDDAKIEVHLGGIDVEGKILDGFWSDSGGDGLVYQEFSGSDEKGELGYGDYAVGDVNFEEIEIKNNISSKFVARKCEGVEEESELGTGDLLQTKDSLEFGGAVEVEGGDGSSPHVEGKSGEFFAKADNSITINEMESGDAEKKRVVWWKLPLELLKFCAFRISPVWSLSIAAAVLGFVILRRRLYKMKQKSRSILPKVSMDEKKVSQFTSRVARLNEAFSVVKRVPIGRAPLPAAGGVTPWPVISMR